MSSDETVKQDAVTDEATSESLAASETITEEVAPETANRYCGCETRIRTYGEGIYRSTRFVRLRIRPRRERRQNPETADAAAP